jgi:nitrogen fixation NifU-like protein
MSDLTDLYQEVILDHNRQPRNFGSMGDATHTANGHNPLCGDKLKVYLKVDGGRVEDVRFEGSGCAISKASASLMTDAIKGRTLDEVNALFERVHTMLTLPTGQDVDISEVGKLAVLSGVREFPVRVKCASLAWHTMKTALARPGATAKTE